VSGSHNRDHVSGGGHTRTTDVGGRGSVMHSNGTDPRYGGGSGMRLHLLGMNGMNHEGSMKNFYVLNCEVDGVLNGAHYVPRRGRSPTGLQKETAL